jgi:uncharacterized protein YukE
MGNITDHIYMDYQSLMLRADELDSLAERMQSVSERYLAVYSANSHFWTGDSGEACRQKLTKLEKNLNKRSKELKKNADGLRRAAKRAKALEGTLSALASR